MSISSPTLLEINEVVPIDGGKIQFFVKEWNLMIKLNNVKQVKGNGTADADKLEKLNDYHRIILQEMIRIFPLGMEKITGEAIRTLVRAKVESHATSFTVFKENNWLRPISELYRRKLVYKDSDNPPHYSINPNKASKALQSGVFGNE